MRAILTVSQLPQDQSFNKILFLMIVFISIVCTADISPTFFQNQMGQICVGDYVFGENLTCQGR